MTTTSFNLTLTANSSSNLSNDSAFDADLSTNTADTANSILNMNSNNGECIDAFGGKDIFGTPDLSNMDEGLFSADAGAETAGSVASAETMGSVAYNSSETAGSVACADGGASAGAAASASSGDGGCGGGSFSSVC